MPTASGEIHSSCRTPVTTRNQGHSRADGHTKAKLSDSRHQSVWRPNEFLLLSIFSMFSAESLRSSFKCLHSSSFGAFKQLSNPQLLDLVSSCVDPRQGPSRNCAQLTVGFPKYFAKAIGSKALRRCPALPEQNPKELPEKQGETCGFFGRPACGKLAGPMQLDFCCTISYNFFHTMTILLLLLAAVWNRVLHFAFLYKQFVLNFLVLKNILYLSVSIDTTISTYYISLWYLVQAPKGTSPGGTLEFSMVTPEAHHAPILRRLWRGKV